MPEPAYRRPSPDEVEDRTLMVRRLLAQGQYDGQIKKVVAAHYKISPRTVERYLRRARDEMLAETGQDKSQLRAEGYGFYREMRANGKASDKDRLKAQERIDKLLGLEAPQKIQVGGDDIDREIRRELDRLAGRRQAADAGAAPGDRNGHA
jgi:hypothetical protein